MSWFYEGKKFYSCRKCKEIHRTSSKIGEAHLKFRYSPRHSLVAKIAKGYKFGLEGKMEKKKIENARSISLIMRTCSKNLEG
jgi:hypothetical protein